MNEILLDFLWELVFREGGIVQSVFYFFDRSNFNKSNLLMALDIELIFREFDIEFITIRNVIYMFAFYLIILKFVKKILDIYALQTDGDANTDIFVMITNFCKAMVIAMSFTTIWEWIFDIAYDFGMQLVGSIQGINSEQMASNTGNSFFNFFIKIREVGAGAGRGDAFFVISILFIFLCFILMIFQIKNGLELWILRLGVPLACCGLLDADQGIFKQYMKLLIKEILTIMIQLALLNIGCFLMMVVLKHVPVNMTDFGTTGVTVILGMIACATIVTAFATPRILSEFLVPKQGGGGKVMQAVYMGSFLLRGVM